MDLSVMVLTLLASVGLGLAGVHAALSIVFWLVQRDLCQRLIQSPLKALDNVAG